MTDTYYLISVWDEEAQGFPLYDQTADPKGVIHNKPPWKFVAQTDAGAVRFAMGVISKYPSYFGSTGPWNLTYWDQRGVGVDTTESPNGIITLETKTIIQQNQPGGGSDFTGTNCEAGFHWDDKTGTCVADTPPPPPPAVFDWNAWLSSNWYIVVALIMVLILILVFWYYKAGGSDLL